MPAIDKQLLAAAIAEARQGLAEGGIPIGSVLADANGKILSRGHNLRVQTGDPTAHAEVVCIRNAGRRTDWHRLILVSTLSRVSCAPEPRCSTRFHESSSVRTRPFSAPRISSRAMASSAPLLMTQNASR